MLSPAHAANIPHCSRFLGPDLEKNARLVPVNRYLQFYIGYMYRTVNLTMMVDNICTPQSLLQLNHSLVSNLYVEIWKDLDGMQTSASRLNQDLYAKLLNNWTVEFWLSERFNDKTILLIVFQFEDTITE